MKLIEYILILSIISTFIACRTAPLDKADKGEKKVPDFAQIQCDSAGQTLGIKTIDDEEVFSSSGLHKSFPKEFRVQPGRHSIELVFSAGNASGEGKLLFDAEAGKTYTVHWKVEGYDVIFWMEDKESGQVVSTTAQP
jgi:hypothetical protein